MIDIILNDLLGDTPIVWDGVVVDNPFINYCREDKSHYLAASIKYVDLDNDFLIGNSGGILLNINFIFVNTHLFTESADHYRKHKCYTFYKPGTVEHTEWKKEEKRRRKYGFTAPCKVYFKDVKNYFNLRKNGLDKEADALIHPLRITGDHYHFLNYSRIKRSRTPDEKKKIGLHERSKKIDDFPLFIDGQYWDHKLDEFCINNGFNICESKARRKGFTYTKAARSANMVNLYQNIVIVNVAYSETFLTEKGAINMFAKTNLDWLEDNTPWARGYLKEQLDAITLGYKKQKEGSKQFGQNSAILAGTLRGNTSAAVGKDALEANFEESGKNPVLQEALNVTISSTEDGDEKIGIIRIFGTGGTKDTNWIDFGNVFYCKGANGMIQMENVWDKNSRNSTCGFFYPQIWGYFPFTTDGNSQLLRAYVRDKQRKSDERTRMTPGDYTIFIGQRANSPEEAFINTIDNMFSSQALTDHLMYIQNNEDLKFYRDGWVDYYDGHLKFMTNGELILKGEKAREYITNVPFDPKKDITGAVRMYYPPYCDVDSVPPKDSYLVVYDPYGKDKAVKDIIIKNSLACIYVVGLRNAKFPYHEDKIVCAYVGRLNTMEETDLIAIKLADMYNAKIVAEMDRGTMLQTAKKFGRKEILAKDISQYIDSRDTSNRDAYGVVIGTGDNKLDLLGQMVDWLYTVLSVDGEGMPRYLFQNITDIPFIKELVLFNMVNNFDRVSCYLAGIKHMKYHAIKNFKQQSQSNKTNGVRKTRSLSSLLLGR